MSNFSAARIAENAEKTFLQRATKQNPPQNNKRQNLKLSLKSVKK